MHSNCTSSPWRLSGPPNLSRRKLYITATTKLIAVTECSSSLTNFWQFRSDCLGGFSESSLHLMLIRWSFPPLLTGSHTRRLQQLSSDGILHCGVLPTAHLPGVPTSNRPGARSSLSCRTTLLLHHNCPPIHPWLSSSHHPRQCWTPAKRDCPLNPGKKSNYFVRTFCDQRSHHRAWTFRWD